MKRAIQEIHTSLKKTHPHIVKKTKNRFKFRYPKITIFALIVVLAYFIFSNPSITFALSHIKGFEYLGAFIGGLLFSYGFTTPFAIGLFISIEPSNIPLAATLGGIGALFSDLVIFAIVKKSFMNEFREIENCKPVKLFERKIKSNLSKRVQLYLLYVTAGLVIASPLPDEIGVGILAGIGHIKPAAFSVISFVFNTLGVLVILLV
jgi:hypothetical protein